MRVTGCLLLTEKAGKGQSCFAITLTCLLPEGHFFVKLADTADPRKVPPAAETMKDSADSELLTAKEALLGQGRPF